LPGFHHAKNIREAQVRPLFDAARMLTTEATGPKR
jgi:hypothetical protein